MAQETGRVVKHIERWDVEPTRVLQQLLKPANRKPESRAERFMLALSQGDLSTMWLNSTDLALKVTLPVVVISLATKAVTGHGLPVSG